MRVTAAKKNMFSIAALLALLVGAIWILAYGGPRENGAGVTMQLEENAQPWAGQTAQADASGVQIMGYETVRIPQSARTVALPLVNPAANACLFQFKIYLGDVKQGDLLYESKLVEPGKAVPEVTLSRALEAGQYDMTIRVTPYDSATGKALNGADVAVELRVE